MYGGDGSSPLAQSQEGLQSEKLNQLRYPLDLLGCGDEVENGTCALGVAKEEGHSPPLGSVRSRLRILVWRCVKERALHRSVQLTTESTSAFLERAVAWQLQLRKTGLEIRCYF